MKKILRKIVMTICALMICVGVVGQNVTTSDAASYGKISLKIVMKEKYYPQNYVKMEVSIPKSAPKSATISNLEKGGTYGATITGTSYTTKNNCTLKVTYFNPKNSKPSTKSVTIKPSDFAKNRTKTITISSSGKVSIK